MSLEKSQFKKMQKTTTEKLNFIKDVAQNYRNPKGKADIAVWCPFCKNDNKHKLKMVIEVDKGIYHCWVCNSKGSNISFLIKKIDQKKYEESLKFFPLRNKSIENSEWNDLLKLLNNDNSDDTTIVQQQVSIPTKFEFCALNLNAKDPDVRDVVNYIVNRGCSEHKMWMLRLGLSRDSNFHRMLIIPSFDKDGNLNFYTCRKIDSSTRDSTKYKNCEISKKSIIFNELLIDWTRPLTLVEGPLDLLKTNDNATCLLGSSLPIDSLLFKRIVENKTPIMLALDHDAYQKAIRIAQDLISYDIDVSIIDTSKADDVGDMSLEMFNDLYHQACKVDPESLLLSRILNIV
jgi:hypothetical protein